MKRQEAVKWMQNLKKEIGKTEHRDLWDYEQVLDEIMEILKQESDNDCISRQELLKRCDFVIQNGIANNNGYHMISVEKVKEVVKSLSSAEPKDKITCKDCVHFNIKGEVVKYGYCDMWNYPIDEFGFCYLGRKE